ncbi:UMP-CMP kinase 2, mitochondrial [Sardina pilchardus]|uniref:UMP-CMP kinase 2, mitochondrial n=1 Tax=Sardina pilchardus TaxID=27697 RepID=UPI002E142CC7
MAKRTMSHIGQWCSRIFGVECAKARPVYFALRMGRQMESTGTELKELFGDRKVYSFHVHCKDRIQRSKWYELLQNKLSSIPSTDCTIMEMSSFLPNVQQSVIKGFLLKLNNDNPITEKVVEELLQVDTLFICSYVQERDEIWQQHLSQTEGLDMSTRYRVMSTGAPALHPSVLNIKNNDVFYSFEDAYKVLVECRDIIPESKAVLDLVDQRIHPSESGKFPVIVIEGLDATGKTTLTESLKETVNAALLKSPPQSLAPLRPRFDCEPPLIRRAFYALGNYITAGQIARESSKAPVIVDRYWHSTAAYAIATAVGGGVGNLPARGSEVYRWPGDLLRPGLVLLLTVDPEERQRRLRGRGLDQTREEAELEANHLFRKKVEEAYKRIEDPACVIVDASPTPDKVLQQVLLLMKNKCHL